MVTDRPGSILRMSDVYEYKKCINRGLADRQAGFHSTHDRRV